MNAISSPDYFFSSNIDLWAEKNTKNKINFSILGNSQNTKQKFHTKFDKICAVMMVNFLYFEVHA
jgi:hypothetical protein